MLLIWHVAVREARRLAKTQSSKEAVSWELHHNAVIAHTTQEGRDVEKAPGQGC